MTDVDRSCKSCGKRKWQKFYEEVYERQDTEYGSTNHYSVEKFQCGNCGKEGRKFTEGSSVTWSGGLRE